MFIRKYVYVYSMYIKHSVNPSRSVSGKANGQQKHVNMNTVMQTDSACRIAVFPIWNIGHRALQN